MTQKPTLGQIFFCIVLGLTIRTFFSPEIFNFLSLIIFLFAFFIDRFFGSLAVEKKLENRVVSLESELKEIKKLQSQFNLSKAIRGIN